ncbi:MAG: hypothetical protein PG981_000862 [Wolbachia endosymbiont of Ctenocephalides orientis wCori]|nr:MAG: hypothetical protein PG981_000862 [Wolbachia endosymbiont of Ctenocephalides orientis wCori]
MIYVNLNIRDIRSALMRYRKKVLIFLTIIALIILFFRNYVDFNNEDIVHLKSDGKEFKRKPEYSIESTTLHREKEVYNNIFSADD